MVNSSSRYVAVCHTATDHSLRFSLALQSDRPHKKNTNHDKNVTTQNRCVDPLVRRGTIDSLVPESVSKLF